jgi:hypothetical protein
MAKNPERRAASFEPENTGFMSGFLADEDVFDRRATWRLGLWAGASIGAVVLAVYASHSSIALRRDQIASVDLARQEQQIQSIAKESQSERRRLASAIDTLNGDRDRLYYRVSALEQGLESVTGTIAKQNMATASPHPAPPSAIATAEPPQPSAQAQAAAPVVSPVATLAKTADATKTGEKAEPATPAEQAPVVISSLAPKMSAAPLAAPTTSVTPKSVIGPPDSAAGKSIESDKTAKATRPTPKPELTPKPEIMAASGPADEAEADASPPSLTQLAVQRTEFGVDVGGANSVNGLRALWRGLLKSRSNAALATLRPIIVIKENSNGPGMQLRLVAGPLTDAAAAAKICAAMVANERPCETAVFDGQRLAINADDPAATKPASGHRSGQWRNSTKHVAVEEAVKKPDPAPATISTFFGRK